MKSIIIFLLCCFAVTTASFSQSTDFFPVKISSIEATSANQFNKLYWKTACFLDFANFEIQRSYNGSDYSTINSFQADRLRCQQPFTFFDSASNQLAGRVYYRLKVGDRDGRVYNSKIVTVFTNGKGIEVNSLVPTLVTSSANLNLSSSENINATIVIFNTLGVAVYSQSLSVKRGVNAIELHTENLAAGKYWLTLHTSKFEKQTVSFLKQ
jgi:hypothetical protein